MKRPRAKRPTSSPAAAGPPKDGQQCGTTRAPKHYPKIAPADSPFDFQPRIRSILLKEFRDDHPEFYKSCSIIVASPVGPDRTDFITMEPPKTRKNILAAETLTERTESSTHHNQLAKFPDAVSLSNTTSEPELRRCFPYPVHSYPDHNPENPLIHHFQQHPNHDGDGRHNDNRQSPSFQAAAGDSNVYMKLPPISDWYESNVEYSHISPHRITSLPESLLRVTLDRPLPLEPTDHPAQLHGPRQPTNLDPMCSSAHITRRTSRRLVRSRNGIEKPIAPSSITDIGPVLPLTLRTYDFTVCKFIDPDILPEEAV